MFLILSRITPVLRKNINNRKMYIVDSKVWLHVLLLYSHS
jgi:hypothetical protein